MEVLKTTDVSIAGGMRWQHPGFYGLARINEGDKSIVVATNCGYLDKVRNETDWERDNPGIVHEKSYQYQIIDQ